MTVALRLIMAMMEGVGGVASASRKVFLCQFGLLLWAFFDSKLYSLDGGLPTVAGSHMSLLRPSQPKSRRGSMQKTGEVSFDFWGVVIELNFKVLILSEMRGLWQVRQRIDDSRL